jgi:uncharacterized protein
MNNRSLVMIAARAPISGQTKTRLGASIGMDAAATLYRAFLHDLAERFDSEHGAHTRRYDLAWTYSPPERDFRHDLEELTGRSSPCDTLFVPQDGPDWGIRQSNLLRWAHEHGYRRTVLMASDSPHLSLATIDDAFAAMESHDVVLGRVRDGGYYLIGMKGFLDVLSGVKMSTASAADGVVQSCRAQGLRIQETEPTFDIDEASDLEYLIQVLGDDPGLCPVTRATLADLGLTSSW